MALEIYSVSLSLEKGMNNGPMAYPRINIETENDPRTADVV